MHVEATAIDGLHVIATKQIGDDRGVVREWLRRSALAEAGLPDVDVRQVNLTRSVRGALRGVHAEAMHKLVGVAAGEAFGAYVDLRPGDAFGTVATVELRVGVQVLVPPGVGNAFQALTDCEYLYCFDREWAPGMEGTAVHALDPDLAIAWPLPVDALDRAQLSAKDAGLPYLADLRDR